MPSIPEKPIRKRLPWTQQGRLVQVSTAASNRTTKKGIETEIKKRAKEKLDAEKKTKKLCQKEFKTAWKAEPKWRNETIRDHFGNVIGGRTRKITREEFREEWLAGRPTCTAYV